jgi:hypothetical protein
MQINDKDAGAYVAVVSGGGARGVAAGTGDNTEVYGEVVDTLAQPGLISGAIIVAGSATLTDAKSISIKSVVIEHDDDVGMGTKADAFTAVDFDLVKTSSGGSTETFAIKLKVNFEGLKRYWRAAITPDLDAANTDVFELGFCVVAIGESAPLS